MDPLPPLRQITLSLRHEAQDSLQDLSANCCLGNHLWLASDEGAALERLTLEGDQTTDHQTYPLTDFLDLPNPAEEEVDIEGLAYSDHYLWITGSHSLKRHKPKPDDSPEAAVKRLKQISCEENRYLIGRIPLVEGQLFRQCPHPDNGKKLLTAAQVQRKKHGNQLTHALQRDAHLGALVKAAIPGKENGFDIEGIAVRGNQVFLGLRGPVLRGWAILLELQVKEAAPEQLRLKPLKGKHPYQKHFLDLEGFGIRDLCWDGDDLLILAGPTLALAGLARVFRISQATTTLAESACHKPTPILDILDSEDQDKAEGLSTLDHPAASLLVVYDSPTPQRLTPNGVKADVFPLPQA